MYLKLVWISLRGQMQYRLSFVMMLIGEFIKAFLEYVGMWALFSRFGTLGSWTLHEVGFFYGIGHIAFALCETMSVGFFIFHHQVLSGDFDRLLLRPRGTALQVLGSGVQLARLGRMGSGVLLLIWSANGLDLAWRPQHAMLLVQAIAGGYAMFTGVVVLQAASSFWTVQSTEVWNLLTYGGVAVFQYPMNIYNGFVRWLFTFFLPLAAVNYWPCSYLLGKDYCPPWWSFAAPALGGVVLCVGLLVWRVGVAHYHSTGS